MKQVKQRTGFVKNGRLFHPFAEIEDQLCAAHKPCRTMNRVPGKTHARCSFRAKELIFFDSSAQGVKELLAEIAMGFQHKTHVAAFDGIVRCKARRATVGVATFSFIAKPEQRTDVRGESVVRLSVNEVAIGGGSGTQGTAIRDAEE